VSVSPAVAVEDLVVRLKEFLEANLDRAREIQIDNVAPITAGNARQAWEFDVRWLDGGTRRKVSCVMLRKAAEG